VTRPAKELMPQVVLLCGGFGLRLRSDADQTAKPLHPLADGRPLLLHVIDVYRRSGCTEFVLCLGYGHEQIRAQLIAELGRFPLRLRLGPSTDLDCPGPEQLSITMLDTGVGTGKAARLCQARPYLGAGTFLFGYADVLSDIDLGALLARHRDGGAAVTMTGTATASRYGHIQADDGGVVTEFVEKPVRDVLISAGFFAAEPRFFDYLDPDARLEGDVLPALAADKQLHLYTHDGLWLPVDTYKDVCELDELINSGRAPWLAPN
jgi:glucose-1-phosphate cytidylyltransferase